MTPDIKDLVTILRHAGFAKPACNESMAADALEAAGFAVVPKSLLAKVQSDPPLTGLAQFDLTAKGIET